MNREYIVNLINNYTELMDENRYTEWLDLFCPDGWYSIVPDSTQVKHVYVIKESTSQLVNRVQSYKDDTHRRTLHFVTNVKINQISGEDSVKAAAHVQVFVDGELNVVGEYRFTIDPVSKLFKEVQLIVHNMPIRSYINLPY